MSDSQHPWEPTCPTAPAPPTGLPSAAPSRSLSLPILAIIALYGTLALLLVPVFPHFASPNEFSRWSLAVSMVERRSFEVGPLMSLLGDRIEDLAEIDGRVYSNKAPGGAFVSVPAYAATRTVLGAARSDNLRQSVTAMRLFTCTLPLLAMSLAFALFAARTGVSHDRIALGIAALLFGTPLFAYGLLFFSHALAAAALFAAWLLLFGDCRLRESVRELLAGSLLGLAAISEYPTAVPSAVLAACALRSHGPAGVLRIAAGAILPLSALAGYNHAAFGSAFALSSSFERDAAYRGLGQAALWGLHLPSPSIGLRLLFDASKGLFVFSPILLLALAAIPAARRRLEPAAFWALTLTPLALFLVYCGYPNWHGGWTVGARYLVPALPFAAYLLLFGRPRWVDPLLLGASAAAVAPTTLVFPFVSPEYAFPWASFAAPLLAKGLVAPNLLHLVSRAVAVATPFAIVAAALVLGGGARRVTRTTGGIIAWTLLGFLCVAIWFPRGDGSRWYVEQVYFERLDVLRRPAPWLAPPVLYKMRVEQQLPPSGWPF